jgi:hypothetical protein
VAASVHPAVRPNLGRPAQLGRIVPEVVSRHGTRTAAQHAVRLGAQELRPAGADPARRRPEPRAAHHGRDRGGQDADPELQQFALDTHVAPARVLPRQPPDQATRLGRKRRTTGPATATSPPPSSSARCQRRSVCGLTAKQDHRSGGSSRLTAASKARSAVVYWGRFRPPKDRQLVAQHDDLKLPLTTTTGEHAEEAAQEPEQQRHQQDALSEPARPRPPTRPSRPESNFLPHRVQNPRQF